MSQSHSRHEESTALTTDADLTAVVSELVERVESLEQTVDEQAEQIESLEQELKEERETRAKESAEDRQRLHDLEETVEDLEETVEEGDITDETPTPEADKNASTEPLTPIERLSESGDSTDVATNVTASVRRAVTLFENLSSWGQSTPKGIVLKPSDRPLQLLEAATEESLAWQQYYRAAEALERLSKGAITFFDHQKHGKTLVLHENTTVHDRSLQSKTGRQQSSLAAD